MLFSFNNSEKFIRYFKKTSLIFITAFFLINTLSKYFFFMIKLFCKSLTLKSDMENANQINKNFLFKIINYSIYYSIYFY